MLDIKELLFQSVNKLWTLNVLHEKFFSQPLHISEGIFFFKWMLSQLLIISVSCVWREKEADGSVTLYKEKGALLTNAGIEIIIQVIVRKYQKNLYFVPYVFLATVPCILQKKYLSNVLENSVQKFWYHFWYLPLESDTLGRSLPVCSAKKIFGWDRQSAQWELETEIKQVFEAVL